MSGFGVEVRDLTVRYDDDGRRSTRSRSPSAPA